MFTKIHDNLWEIPKSFRADMRVPARIYISKKMLDDIAGDRSIEQLVNVATLPGIQKYALAMPDIHEGYGFPIGGVAAFDIEKGIISPGGIGYDINCGVRLLRSALTFEEIKPHLDSLARELFHEIPSGVGRGGPLKLSVSDLDKILEGGAPAMIEMGYGEEGDEEHLESHGVLTEARHNLVSEHAKARGRDQLGTMGAGNHFVEVDVVDEVYDSEEAEKMGLAKGNVVVLIHMGSRGLGHQVATDFIRIMMRAMPKYGIEIPDRELACTPFKSKEGQDYFGAMSAAANFAWANRQLVTHEVRTAWNNIFGDAGGGLDIVYDVAHNLAKREEYTIDGVRREVIVHRKGATRAFPGQPVLIPGSMGTHSYVLVGQEAALEESFGSSCHGAGRRMSRTKARKEVDPKELKARLKSLGIAVASASARGLTEEAPEAYKDVDEVVEVVDQAGIAKKVVRIKPVAVVKG